MCLGRLGERRGRISESPRGGGRGRLAKRVNLNKLKENTMARVPGN